jgi:hypothetical protein
MFNSLTQRKEYGQVLWFKINNRVKNIEKHDKFFNPKIRLYLFLSTPILQGLILIKHKCLLMVISFENIVITKDIIMEIVFSE